MLRRRENRERGRVSKKKSIPLQEYMLICYVLPQSIVEHIDGNVLFQAPGGFEKGKHIYARSFLGISLRYRPRLIYIYISFWYLPVSPRVTILTGCRPERGQLYCFHAEMPTHHFSPPHFLSLLRYSWNKAEQNNFTTKIK